MTAVGTSLRDTPYRGLAHSRLMGELARRRVVVHGDVQGVFFRDSTREEASRRGVAGWVTNRPDGAVEAVFEGDPEAVEALVAFCREGPRRARVDRVEESAEEPEGLDGFRVR
jgi:acylphosphatase